jgi:hypothetical protein
MMTTSFLRPVRWRSVWSLSPSAPFYGSLGPNLASSGSLYRRHNQTVPSYGANNLGSNFLPAMVLATHRFLILAF